MNAALQIPVGIIENPNHALVAENGAPLHGRQATIHLHSALTVSATIADAHAAERAEFEDFVSMMFKRVHQATVTHFMPQLMGLRNTQGQLLAVCGIRHAEQAPLFLETYLDAPIEQTLSAKVGKTVQRHTILEIGNLAVQDPASVRNLIASVSVYLHSTDSDWAVFTGITTLRNSLTKLNMPLQLLGEASITRLPEAERAAWGSYYEERPLVMAIGRMQ